jgi:hypothetical protein
MPPFKVIRMAFKNEEHAQALEDALNAAAEEKYSPVSMFLDGPMFLAILRQPMTPSEMGKLPEQQPDEVAAQLAQLEHEAAAANTGTKPWEIRAAQQKNQADREKCVATQGMRTSRSGQPGEEK